MPFDRAFEFFYALWPQAIKRPWTKFQLSFPQPVFMLFLHTPLFHLKFGIRVIATFRKRLFFVNGDFSFPCVFSPSHSYPTGFPYFPRRSAANCEESKEEEEGRGSPPPRRDCDSKGGRESKREGEGRGRIGSGRRSRFNKYHTLSKNKGNFKAKY